jgi:23S rRNA pseudouridine1911/1915/1917 synthase
MHPPPDAFQILYEDDGILAVNKPAGLHVFSQSRGERQSLWSILKRFRPELDDVGDRLAPAFVHRLDRGTSGILLAAKTDPVYRKLRNAFEAGEIEKEYLALVEGEVSEPVEVDLPVGSRYRRSKKVQVQLPGRKLRGVRPARTAIAPLDSGDDLTLCRVRIYTGVRHQIRAHLSHLRHPVAGDREYGARREIAGLGARTFLHAWRLRLPHPLSGSQVEIACPLPGELLQILDELGLDSSTSLDLKSQPC